MIGTVSRPGRFHLDLAPVRLQIGNRRVTVVGAMFHSGSVMIEYDVEPPLTRDNPFGPCILVLVATDDASADIYPTTWEDFDWGFMQPGRMTTRLDRRPPAQATELRVGVHEPVPAGPTHAVAGAEIGRFVVQLPIDHGAYHRNAR
jgi:hypothetical protein